MTALVRPGTARRLGLRQNQPDRSVGTGGTPVTRQRVEERFGPSIFQTGGPAPDLFGLRGLPTISRGWQ